MARLRWAVVALAVLEAGWMVFDGARALVVGDYVTPSTGEHAGQLGPWADLVGALGVDPRSTGMKAFFVLYGVGWLAVAAAFARGRRWAWAAMLAAAAGSLWYLVVGTVASAVMIALLVVPAVRRRAGGWTLRAAFAPIRRRP